MIVTDFIGGFRQGDLMVVENQSWLPSTDSHQVALAADDLSVWSAVNTGPIDVLVNGSGAYGGPIAFNGERWVIITSNFFGGQSRYLYSDDLGASWNSGVLPLQADWVGLAWNGSYFLATLNAGTQCMRSFNGTSWTVHTLVIPSSSGPGQTPARWDGNRWVAISGGSNVILSNDGITWARAGFDPPGPPPFDPADLPSFQFWRPAYDDNGHWVAVNTISSSDRERFGAYNHNGLVADWSPSTLPDQPGFGYQSVAYGNGSFVAVPGGGNIAAYSTNNGVTWNSSTLPYSANWRDIVFNGDYFYALAADAPAVGSHFGIARSETGSSWTAMPNGVELGGGAQHIVSTYLPKIFY
jgi:hypothetical protein